MVSLKNLLDKLENLPEKIDAPYDQNYIHLACKSENLSIEMLKLLVEKKIDTLQIASYNRNCLMDLCQNKNATLEMLKYMYEDKEGYFFFMLKKIFFPKIFFI